MPSLRSLLVAAFLGSGFLLLAAACGGGGGPTAALPASFRLLASDPADGGLNVGRDRMVVLRFTDGLDSSSVAPNTVTVTATGVGAIPGTTTHIRSGDGSELRWVPAQLLPASRDHVCRVDPSLRNAAGETLGTPAEVSFRSSPEVDPVSLPQQADLRPTAGALAVGRHSHRATLLLDGRVLVTGGFSLENATTDVAEIYDVNNDRFAASSGPMAVARAGHSATRLATGQVLLVGGRTRLPNGSLVPTDSVERFDPGTGQFTPVASLPAARYDHAAILLGDGRVLVTGGTDAGFVDLASALVYDPDSNTWTDHASTLAAPRATHVMVQLDGRYSLIAGGAAGLRTCEVFDSTTGLFEQTNRPDQEGQRYGAAAGVYASGASMVCGGDLTGAVLYIYAGSNFVQNSGSPLWRPRAYATATALGTDGDRFLVVGGIDFSRGNNWIDGTCDVVLEGGVGGSRTYATNLRFPTGMAKHTATRLVSGDILFCGGMNENGSQPNLSGAYILDAQ